MKNFSWKRIAAPAAIAAALVIGIGFYAVRQARQAASGPDQPVRVDPAVAAQTAGRASAGDVSAQLQMGVWCVEGTGQPLDYARAAEWFRKAAEKGNAEAQCHLAELYQAGRGVERNFTNALAWLTKAAAQHNAAALYSLGSMYEAGQGTAADSQTAARYIRQAAEMGDAYAQYNMARRCESGHGVPKDLTEAWKWYELADSGGVPDNLHARQGLEARLTPEELRQAHAAVETFRRQATGQKRP